MPFAAQKESSACVFVQHRPLHLELLRGQAGVDDQQESWWLGHRGVECVLHAQQLWVELRRQHALVDLGVVWRECIPRSAGIHMRPQPTMSRIGE